jgi:hypothetical protein
MMTDDYYVVLGSDESVKQQVKTGASQNGAAMAGDTDAPELSIIVRGLTAVQTDGAALAAASVPIAPNRRLISRGRS